VKTHYRATFTSEPRNATLARRSIASFAAVCGFSDEDVADIRLAAGEALSNAVEHGRSARGGGFSVSCTFDDGELVIEIRDSGEGFASPINATEIDPEQRERGFGIFLMRRLMDRVTFDRNGSTVRLARRREAEGR
jgi:serine/threonine-protein kinase RsbW